MVFGLAGAGPEGRLEAEPWRGVVSLWGVASVWGRGLCWAGPRAGAWQGTRNGGPRSCGRLWGGGAARNRSLAPHPVPTASPGEVAPGGGPVAAATGAGLRRFCGARVPSLQSFAPAVLLPWIPVPRLPGPQGPQAGTLSRGSRQARRCPGPRP